MIAIDCNTIFGRKPSQRTDNEPAVLDRELARHGIGAALTLSRRGVDFEHQLGNEETLAVCKGFPRFIPVATITPLRYLSWQKDVDWCLANGFRAFRFFPEEQRWSVQSVGFQKLLERLAPTKVPLLFTVTTTESATEIARATADSGLPVILLGQSYSTQSETMHVVQRFPHVYCETVRLATPHAVRLFIDECGADRLLYGSNAPQNDVQPSMNAVFEDDLSHDEVRQIMSGNILRLLGMAESAIPPCDVEPGLRFYPGPTIDTHAHLGPWRFPIVTVKTDTMLGYARQFNLEKIVISSALGIVYDMAEGNRELKEWIDPHPELLGYVVTNPNFVEESAAEMDRYYKYPNFVGAKIHGEYSATATAAPRMAALFEEIARRGKPVKIHNAGPGWQEAIHALAKKHPDLKIIIAHGGGWGMGAIVKDTPNVYLEYCGSSSTRGLIREGLEVLGDERLMFGSDQDLLDPGYMLGKYYDVGFTPTQAEKIMYANAKRLYGLG